MPRRKTKSFEREIGRDIRFQSHLVQKFINVIMERGKKNLARSIVYDAFDIVAQKTNSDSTKAFLLFEKAVEKIRPVVEVRSRRIGGGVYQIPVEVRKERSLALALRWLMGAAAKRTDKTMSQRLAWELMDAVEGRGGAFKKRVDVHKMAEANRAFSHYAW